MLDILLEELCKCYIDGVTENTDKIKYIYIQILSNHYNEIIEILKTQKLYNKIYSLFQYPILFENLIVDICLDLSFAVHFGV